MLVYLKMLVYGNDCAAMEHAIWGVNPPGTLVPRIQRGSKMESLDLQIGSRVEYGSIGNVKLRDISIRIE
jgi:hypothetical protein